MSLPTKHLTAMPAKQLSPKEMLAAAERDFEEVWNEGNLEAIDELYAADCTIYGPEAGEAIHGREAMKKYVASVHEAFPDLELRMDDSVAADGKVAIRFTWEGTHEGPLPNGVPATGKHVTVSGIGFVTFDGDEFEEIAFYDDFESMMDQLGLMPEI